MVARLFGLGPSTIHSSTTSTFLSHRHVQHFKQRSGTPNKTPNGGPNGRGCGNKEDEPLVTSNEVHRHAGSNEPGSTCEVAIEPSLAASNRLKAFPTTTLWLTTVVAALTAIPAASTTSQLQTMRLLAWRTKDCPTTTRSWFRLFIASLMTSIKKMTEVCLVVVAFTAISQVQHDIILALLEVGVTGRYDA
jgi:hypothetical protein